MKKIALGILIGIGIMCYIFVYGMTIKNTRINTCPQIFSSTGYVVRLNNNKNKESYSINVLKYGQRVLVKTKVTLYDNEEFELNEKTRLLEHWCFEYYLTFK